MATQPVADDFRTRVKQASEAGVITGDGHGLYSPEFYAPHFTAEELAGLVHKYESDPSSWKSTIYDANGNAVTELEAIYNLDFLYWVVRQLNITEYGYYNGRGSQAQELARVITEALA